MSLPAVADAIAATLSAGLGDTRGVYSAPVPNVEAGSAVVVPSSEWGTFDDSTFCRPSLSWDVVLFASATDWSAAMDWLQLRIDEMVAAFSTDPTLGGVVDGVAVASWQAPEIVTVGAVELLSVRVSLTPTSAI